MKGTRASHFTLSQKFSQAQECTATHARPTDLLKLIVTTYLRKHETNNNYKKIYTPKLPNQMLQ